MVEINTMKKIIYLFLIVFTVVACGGTEETTNKENDSIVGKWTLYKEVKKGKSFNYNGVPTATKIEFKENGYFILFDEITDEKINNDNIGSIQEDFKGQYEVTDKLLKINRFDGDSSSSETLTINELSSNELILKSDNGRLRYFKR